MAQILISLFDTHSRAVDAKSALLAIGVKPECIELHAGPTEHPSDTQTRDGLAELPETDRLERFFSRVFGSEERPNEVGHFNEGVRRGGTLLVYGVYPEKETVRFNPFDLFRREITIKGSFAQIDAFPRALAYLESGKIKVNDIVTDEFALEDWPKVLEHAWSRKGIKIAVIPPS